jgi:hypothetical protein
MDIRTISDTEVLVIADVTRTNGQQVTRRARAEYWENDLRNGRRPWKI